MFKKLVIVSIISVNVGYTLFLFPILGFLYPNRVPLTLHNLVSFLFIDTIWGAVLATLIYSVAHIARIGFTKAIAISITLLWIAFWASSTILTGKFTDVSTEDVIVICIDGVAALITGIILSKTSSAILSQYS